jgi:long-chain fatty acid transport protein
MHSQNRDPYRIVLMVLGLLFLTTAAVRGGGFAADEQSVRAMGMSGAFLSSDDDPAVIFDNSAAIAFIDHHQLLVGGHLEWARTTLEGADPFPGSDASEKSANGVRLQPAASYIAPFSKQFVMGIGFRTPFDLATIWSDPETFSGRFLAQDTQIVSREILPTIAIRLADRLSIGAGVGVLFSDRSFHVRHARCRSVRCRKRHDLGGALSRRHRGPLYQRRVAGALL